MMKRIAAGLAVVSFMLVLGAGTASAGGEMTHNCVPGPTCDMTHN